MLTCVLRTCRIATHRSARASASRAATVNVSQCTLGPGRVRRNFTARPRPQQITAKRMVSDASAQIAHLCKLSILAFNAGSSSWPHCVDREITHGHKQNTHIKLAHTHVFQMKCAQTIVTVTVVVVVVTSSMRRLLLSAHTHAVQTTAAAHMQIYSLALCTRRCAVSFV